MFKVVVDAHSKRPEVVHMQRITAQQTVETFKTIFARFGYPEVLVLNDGKQFSASEFTVFCAENGIPQLTTAPYHPQSNGQVERFVDMLKRAVSHHTASEHPANTLRVVFEEASKNHVRLDVSEGNRSAGGSKEADGKTSKECDDRHFKIGGKVRVSDYTGERNPWREGIIVGQREQVTWFVRIREMTWKRSTSQLRRIGGEPGNGEAAQDLEMASLPDEETAICLVRRNESCY
ncbi:hypothetical protein M514_19896 [Trichuris suis]|uniref:Integrase catalytic domain-containing protein n=1 Tax=Trichuris suis TaxID=68888 RepID=A0A085NEX3_9BILA|nr:hypothetical protein M514_19896 [Trichuris suis]